MTRENYVEPEMDIIEFEAEDVIVTSAGSGATGNDGGLDLPDQEF